MNDFILPKPFVFASNLLTWTDLNPTSKEALLDAYTSSERGYHAMHHIAFLWERHLTLAQHLNKQDYRRIANAIACHDVVYDAKSKTNEADSAQWWRTHVVPQHLDASDINWVFEAIEATANHFAVRPMDSADDVLLQWFLGLDLISLAAPYEVFQQNTLMIRAEYSHLSDDEWNSGRKGFLLKAEDAPAIYRHPQLHEMFEESARANIETALSELA